MTTQKQIDEEVLKLGPLTHQPITEVIGQYDINDYDEFYCFEVSEGMSLEKFNEQWTRFTKMTLEHHPTYKNITVKFISGIHGKLALSGERMESDVELHERERIRKEKIRQYLTLKNELNIGE